MNGPLGGIPGAGLGVSPATVSTIDPDETFVPEASWSSTLIGTLDPLLLGFVWS